MNINLDEYTSHINDPDKLIKMRRVLDKIGIVMRNHSVETSDFLDPYERKLAKSILNRFTDINYAEFGGFEESERRVMAIFPDYQYEEDIDYSLSALKITKASEDLNHRDYLGAILQLGIERTKIGDILVQGDSGFIVLKSEIKDFILFNLEKIGNENIDIRECEIEEIVYTEPNFKEIREFLNSLRLDLVISAVCKISRNNSAKIINSNKVKVNWENIDKGSKELEIGDVVSVRGFGRFIIHSFQGHSKKGNLNIVIRILI